ncbi:MAG TPA: 2-C-methyl-D-erythritol 2,4-cyclodiphosphate synthase [Gemmatimonadaceae bacterium]|nr:2-C-methyl-D-erythritol 2,4-cyclodiphosphate synthase [Gemmatimonadaceae bacterium]
MRVGLGYDSHRFVHPGPLVLGGVRIPFDLHLEGHSDGDAVCHALTDAILGAAGQGDIGEMFPDTDPKNAGRDSVEMLAVAVQQMRARGFAVAQADITIITESPRLSAYRTAMRERLAQAMGVDVGLVSIKAKSNERMGWIGRGEGVACIAVATLSST